MIHLQDRVFFVFFQHMYPLVLSFESINKLKLSFECGIPKPQDAGHLCFRLYFDFKVRPGTGVQPQSLNRLLATAIFLSNYTVTEGDWLVYVVNRSPWNLSISCDCMVYWLSKKSDLEKIVRGNQKIGIIRLICITFCSGICWIGYHIMPWKCSQCNRSCPTTYVSRSPTQAECASSRASTMPDKCRTDLLKEK
jgi:hypothetical protein